VAEAKKHLPPLEHFYGLHQLGLLVFAWFVSVAAHRLLDIMASVAAVAHWHIKTASQLHRVHLIQ
jgi:hypothetical protein